MITPTLKQFRIVAVVALVSWLATSFLPHTEFVSFSEEVRTLRTWNYFGAVIPFWSIQIWWVISGLLTVYGLLGMIRLWSSARFCLAAALVASFLLQPLIGLAVYSPFEASLAGVFGASAIWLVCVSLYSPLAHRFNGAKDT